MHAPAPGPRPGRRKDRDKAAGAVALPQEEREAARDGSSSEGSAASSTCSLPPGQSHAPHDSNADASEPVLQVHGARTSPSSLLRVRGLVRAASGVDVCVQPLIDSGASGEGFVDPAFVERCGAVVRPSARRIALADGREVAASGEVTLSYTLATQTAGATSASVPVRFTSTFIVTPLAPHDIILGIGWLERHRAHVEFRERYIQVRVNGVGQEYTIRPMERCEADGSRAAQAAPLHLQAITQRRLGKMVRHGEVAQMYAILSRPAEEEGIPGSAAAAEAVPLGADDPRIAALIREFGPSVFAEPKPGVPPARGVEHAIQLKPGSVPPLPRPLRHQSAKDAEVIRQYVEAGLASGMLRPSVSPYGAAIMVVPKPDGSPRIVVDYRALNSTTVRNQYPLPLIDELFDKVVGAKYFTSMDLRDGFYQIRLREEDRHLTAFRTRQGSYEYTVLPMGLCNSPATFQQLMNMSFGDMLDKHVLCYLDDILIFSRTEEEHLRHVRDVLVRLQEKQLYVKLRKCAFLQSEVRFLGHRVGAEGLRVSADKTDAIQEWPRPPDVKELQRFLGLANFYRRFVRDYSRIALPLTELTKHATPWVWGAPQQQAFDELKAALCSPPVLLIPDQSRPFVLAADACGYAIGATLQQDKGNGLQPVAYFSAKLDDAERNYPVRELEFLAIMRACQYWRHYLHGTQPFVLQSDHDSLQYVRTSTELKGRLARWVDTMAEYDYVFQYVRGKDNVVADALSRRGDHAGAVQGGDQLAMADARGTRRRRRRARRQHAPEPLEVRQRNIDAATKVSTHVSMPHAGGPIPDKHGTIVTPTQRCSADTKAGVQCAQRTAVAHLCWNHLRRDMGVRVGASTIASAGRGLFAAWPAGLKKGHRIPYTGDLAFWDSGEFAGPYVLETRPGEGIDAARRNCGLARWVNDPRGAVDEQGRTRRANAKFVIAPGGGQRVAAVLTTRAVPKGEEILVSYGKAYWRFFRPAGEAEKARKRRSREQRGQQQRRRDADEAAVVAAVVTRAARAASAAATTPPVTLPVTTTPQRTLPQAPAPQQVADKGADAEPLLSAVRRAGEADPEYAAALRTPPAGVHANRGVLYDDAGNVQVPNDAALRTRILSELHDSPTGVHCGRDRMLAEAQRRFVWRGMARDVELYASTCDACQRNKHSKQCKPGLLMPLPLPEKPCRHWTTDAVTGLPRTKSGFDAIQVYVDRLTKLKRFAATRTTDGSKQLAHTTLRTLVPTHGMPLSITSDRDSRITAAFWRALTKRLHIKVKLSTAYHPQTDGQSEREIQTLVTALRGYVNEHGDDWDEYLPFIELGFNSKVQASTGLSPFAAAWGYEPLEPIDYELGDEEQPVTVPAAEERAVRIKKALDHARSKAERAQEKQKRLADRHRRLLQLKAGDQVLLSTEGLHLRSGTHKLTGRYIGPFRVVGCVNNNAVTLELPALLSALHPTVNISRLKPYRDGLTAFPTRPVQFTQPPAVDSDTNGAPQYEVECAVASRGKGARRELLVRWKGYGPEDDTWQRRSELKRMAPRVVEEYDARQQGATYVEGTPRAA